ncbi:hypothetical protein SAMN05444366_0553 [Flavobacterium saccharophilum]|uniref:Uncharacterized protein n=1 Tax=Flavobacterium saccharophilum TaxID=29534 RepID=A0A1M7A7X2_9FLAO|nr:hypothetical protein SAMN05444366_0553 [Flavobacterium saccharophilum]
MIFLVRETYKKADFIIYKQTITYTNFLKYY